MKDPGFDLRTCETSFTISVKDEFPDLKDPYLKGELLSTFIELSFGPMLAYKYMQNGVMARMDINYLSDMRHIGN